MTLQDVSRETNERLEHYESMLRKWSSRINLVSRNDLENIRSRHLEDSVQLYGLVRDWTSWLDLGSGGGFPGIVIAILSMDYEKRTITLVECDKRKSVFLQTVARDLEIPVKVIAQRIEKLDPDASDVISARALASLEKLLTYSRPLSNASTTCIFPKGRSWKTEVEDAQKHWSFRYEVVQSKTDPEAVILKISELQRG